MKYILKRGKCAWTLPAAVVVTSKDGGGDVQETEGAMALKADATNDCEINCKASVSQFARLVKRVFNNSTISALMTSEQSIIR